jgi:hypothetical protein
MKVNRTLHNPRRSQSEALQALREALPRRVTLGLVALLLALTLAPTALDLRGHNLTSPGLTPASVYQEIGTQVHAAYSWGERFVGHLQLIYDLYRLAGEESNPALPASAPGAGKPVPVCDRIAPSQRPASVRTAGRHIS